MRPYGLLNEGLGSNMDRGNYGSSNNLPLDDSRVPDTKVQDTGIAKRRMEGREVNTPFEHDFLVPYKPSGGTSELRNMAAKALYEYMNYPPVKTNQMEKSRLSAFIGAIQQARMINGVLDAFPNSQSVVTTMMCVDASDEQVKEGIKKMFSDPSSPLNYLYRQNNAPVDAIMAH